MLSAIHRLEGSGFIKRVKARKKGSRDVWLLCVKLLRPPNDDDYRNLDHRKKVSSSAQAKPSVLEEDQDGVEIMRDLELEVDFDEDGPAGGGEQAEAELDESGRIPPQWHPNRQVA